ncbi:MAG: TMEM165/GDT1 family protein [Promethearchaeota archaeon]
MITFGLLFIGELGDKTQLIVFNLALDYKKFYKVGIGATVAFALLVTIGVFFGAVITKFIPLFIISIVSGLVFIIIGIFETRDLKELYLNHKLKKQGGEISSVKGAEPEENKFSRLKKNPYAAGFGFIFLMELGDKTQILTITLASIYSFPIEVWLGSFFALISVAWMGILIGSIIARKVPKLYLKIVSISLFLFVGVLILVTSF